MVLYFFYINRKLETGTFCAGLFKKKVKKLFYQYLLNRGDLDPNLTCKIVEKVTLFVACIVLKLDRHDKIIERPGKQ